MFNPSVHTKYNWCIRCILGPFPLPLYFCFVLIHVVYVRKLYQTAKQRKRCLQNIERRVLPIESVDGMVDLLDTFHCLTVQYHCLIYLEKFIIFVFPLYVLGCESLSKKVKHKIEVLLRRFYFLFFWIVYAP